MNKNQLLSIGGIQTNKLQAYIAEIQSIKNADYGDFGALQMQEYANALSELEPTQAAVLLSTQGLTNAQIQQTLAAKGLSTEMQYQAMAEAGLLSSSTKLTNTKLQSVLATQLESDAKAEEVMTSMGLTVAKEGEDAVTVKLTAKKLQEAVASGVLTEAQAQELAMTLGVTTATNAQAASVIPAWIAKMEAMTAAVWAQVKATAVWLATNPAGWAILGATAIYGISKAISHYNKKQEEAKQKIKELGETAKQSADEIKKNFEETKSSVDDIAPRYAELAQQVQNLGKATQNQGYLSNDDYQEFLDLSNQLAELFPQLTSGYDSNGNAILKLDGSIQNITTSIYSYVDALERANSVELQEKFGDIWNSNKQDFDDYSKQAQEAQDNFDNLQQTYQRLQQILSNDSKSGTFDVAGGLLPKIFENADIALAPLIDQTNGGYDFSELSDKEIIDIQNAYSKMLQEYKDDAEYFTSQVATTNKNTADYIISSLQGDRIMQSVEESFGEDGVNIINGILSNLDYGNLFEGMSGEDIIEQIKKDYLFKLSNLDDTDKTAFKEAWNNLLAIDTDAALSENIPKIETYIKQIADLLDIDWTTLAPAFGYDIDASKKQIQDLKDRMGYSHKSGYALSNKESDVNQKINELTQGLTQDELNILVDVELPSNVLNMTEEEFKAWIQKLQDEAVIDVETRTASDAIDSFAEMKSALSSLDELYSQTVLQNSDINGIINGFASPDTINTVESAFGGIAEEDAKVADALESFEDTLVKFPNDAQKAQSAIDSLITAYIDQTDVIKDLTEENKDYAKAQLKAMGITNADEVVESRLSNTNKELTKGYSELTDNVKKYNEAVKSSDVSAQEEQVQQITDKLNQMYKTGLTDNKGNEILSFDTNAVLQNMDTVQAAVQGDIDAMNQLAIMAGKSYIAHLQIDGDTHTVDAMKNNLYTLLSSFDGANIAIGTSMDNSPIIQGLIAIGQQARMTSEEIAEMIKRASGGTISADVDYTTAQVDLPVFNTVTRNGKSFEVRTGYSAKKQQVKIPRFKYKYTGAGGTKANYGGGGSSSKSSGGSGGSGGGGGGSSSDNQDETFDWIEVAINRAEEQISRLDKVVENTFDNWTNRSKALNDEISKTADEIGLQKKAYQGYIDKANSIGLSDDYKRKVQNGTIQIETITDDKLKEKLQDYQNWYNKAVACNDKIQELNISLSELAQKKFDNIVTQFEDMESEFTSLNDIIDKLVDYAETKGRIISKSYYEAMLQNENENNKLLVQQRDQMVAELQEMLQSGRVTEYSEAWYDLHQKINDVNASIIDSNKSIQEFYNNMRQADWDLFDLVQDKITGIADEIEFVQSLLEDRDNLTDGHLNRGLTNEGLAQLGNYASKYNIYMSQAEKYASEIKKIEADIAKDPANQDLVDRKEELVKAQRDVILSANDEKKSMIDLARDGYDAMLEVLQKLIDKRKEYLDNEKSIYEYQQSIQEKTDSIAAIQKQLSVFENDNSEESKKRIQQLQVDLKDAQQDLKDTEYDKYIEDQEKMLDDLYQEYSDKIDEKFEQTEILIQELIGVVNENQSSISDTITTVTSDVGYTISDQMKTIWSDAGTVISGFTGKFDTYTTTVQSAINSIQITIDKMLQIAQAEANKNIATANNPNSVANGSSSTAPKSQATPKANTSNNSSAQAPKASPNVGTRVNATGNWYYDSYGTAPTGNVNRFKPDYFEIDKIANGRAYPYHIQAIIRGKRAGGNGWVKGNQIGYKNGLKEATYDHLAWTQEEGAEIIRRSDGSILTPITRGTTVFTREMTDNLWNIAKQNPEKFYQNAMPTMNTFATTNRGGDVTVSIGDIKLDGIQNPDQFAQALIGVVKDYSKVQKVLQAATVDLVAGKSIKDINRF